MIKNYLKIAFRNLMKYKFISFINLFGITVGLTCCLLILIYITHELSYDQFNPNANRIYRVTRSFISQDGVENLHLSEVAPPFGPLLKHDFPDIEKMTRLLNNGTTSLKYEDKLFNEKNVFFADTNFFQFFPVPVVKGNPATALAEPYSIMMTEEMAKKYFGDADPINKFIRVDNQANCRVTGVFKKLPGNVHMHPEILLSFTTLNDSTVYGVNNLQTNYGNNAFFTYLQFPAGYPVEKIESRFPAFIDEHVRFKDQQPGIKQSKYTKLFLQKLTDIHLKSHLADEAEPNGDINRIYIFGSIALFILLIACINYMNLSTARSALRAREIGVRKVVGALRKEIITQFLSESVMVTFIALLFAILLTRLALPLLGSIAGQEYSFRNILHAPILVSLLILPILVGFVSGLYPALFMSSFKPVTVLKGVFKVGKSNISFRQILVITQFTISIILIVATVVVFRQLSYMQHASLGYNKDHIVTLPYGRDLDKQYEAFRNQLLQDPDIRSLGRSSRIPTGRLLDDLGAKVFSGDSLVPISSNLKFIATDYYFIPTYQIGMAAGRNFSKDYPTDTSNYIINESAVQMLGWKTPDNAIGKDIVYGRTRGKIIGVVKDFHFESMHQKIIPLLFLVQFGYGSVSIKVNGANIGPAITQIEKTWKQFLPEIPFQYTFLDENFGKLYSSEQQQGKIFIIFSFIAIFIACLGLFGLSAFAISQRIKEIGIRKVLGASISQIVTMISKDFLKLVCIAAMIAFPVSWLAMNRWLQDFAYRISMVWWIFLVAAAIAAMIALITISVQAIKAAIANPAQSLRTE